jgi:LPXTG-site transpeptidase (sortase) family protein
MRWTNILARLRRPLTCFASVAVAVGSAMPIGQLDAVASSAAPTVRRVVATPIPIPVFTPVRIEIAKIDVNNPVVPVGTLQSGKMEAPKTAADVGWWKGRKVGQGNVLLDGHRDWSGAHGSFYRLKELKQGDTLSLHGEKGKKATYRVVWVKRFDRTIDATDLLGNKTKAQIATLITCEGVFDRSAGTAPERMVVRAELVST